MRTLLKLFIVWLATVSYSQTVIAGLTISFTGSTGNTDADNGFQRAANFISSKFTDNVTITIDRGFDALAPNVLGQAGSASATLSYSLFRNQLIADATSSNDAIMTSNLPSGATYSAYLNRTLENSNLEAPYVDNNGSTNNQKVEITTANARALGFNLGAFTDAAITFSSSFTWDFDNSDGISAGSQDFVGVAIHEIMHSMGFVSNVDFVDGDPGQSEDLVFATSLDFTRFSTDSYSFGATVDLTADTRAKYFSIDGGVTNLTPGASGGFSTGSDFGDGRQASHWKDGLGLGIMDPTANPAGQVNTVSNLDLLALDVIGWDSADVTAVPEPGSLALMSLVSAIGVGVRYRRRKSI